MQRNTETASPNAADHAHGLDSLQVARRPGPRFVGLPLSHSDAITLLLFAEQLVELYDGLTRAHYGRPIPCELTAEIRAIIERAEHAAKVEVLQVLQGIEEAA